MAETSLQSYFSLLKEGEITKRQIDVMSYFLERPHRILTRQDLSEETGIPLHTVCGRVNELVALGVLVSHGETAPIPELRIKSRELVGLPKAHEQLDLFH